MKRNLYLTSSAAMALALALAIQGTSINPAQATQTEDADSDFSIEEIIVTARKREENIQDAPLSIAAFTSDMIEAANIKTLDDIAKFTAGFSFDEDFQRTNSSRPVIRGQSTIKGESGVSIFIDGILITGPILDYDLNDVERVEIIKGPQSALYGRNTYSGAISITTKSPTDEVSGQVRFEGAGFDQYDISASIRGPLSDTLSASLTGRYYDRGGPFFNNFDSTRVGQQQSKSLSGVLYYQPNSPLEIRLRARWSELNDDQPRLFTTDPSENNCFFDDGGVYNGHGRYFCGEITEHPISIDDVRLLGEKGFDKNTSWQTSVTVNYELSDSMSLTWINGYNHTRFKQKGDFGFNDESFNPFSVHLFDAPFGPPPTPFTAAVVIAGPVVDFAADLAGNDRDYSSELRLAFEGDGWNMLIGGYYFDSRNSIESNRVAPPGFGSTVSEAYFGERDRMVAVCNANVAFFAGPCTAEVYNLALGPNAFPDFAFAANTIGLTMLTLDANRDLVVDERRNLATFGRVSRDFTDQLTVSVEARVTSEKITSNTTEGIDSYDFLGNLTGSTSVVTPQRQKTFTNIDPRFTASYAVSDGSNLYAVAARGAKPGGFNDTEVIPLGLGAFDQENVWSFELGSKNVFMDGRFILNLAGFHNRINGYQLTEAVIIPALNETKSVITNKGKVRVKGLEIEAIFAPQAIPGLIFDANYAYTDSEFLEGTDEIEGQLQDVLGDQSLDCDPCSGSIAGRQLPRQAKHMYNVGVNYTRPVTDNWSIALRGSLSHESKKFVQVHNLAWVGSVTLVSASIAFESESLRVVFWGKNLTDEDSVVSASRFADEGASFQRIFMGNPRLGRQFGATASYRF